VEKQHNSTDVNKSITGSLVKNLTTYFRAVAVEQKCFILLQKYTRTASTLGTFKTRLKTTVYSCIPHIIQFSAISASDSL